MGGPELDGLEGDGGEQAGPRSAPLAILGPLRVTRDGQPVDLGSRKQQVILALLLCNAGSPVLVSALSQALWDDQPPRTARKNIQVYVCTLRGLVGPGGRPPICHDNGSYTIDTDPADVDALLFTRRVQQARALSQGGDRAGAAAALAGALDLWRGPALEGLRGIPLVAAAAQRLDRRYLAAFEDWAEAEVALGRGAGATERIAEVAAIHPLRERLRTLQMSALCHAGRRSEALAVYDELRQLLAHELGLSPSPALAAFYQSIVSGRPRPASGDGPGGGAGPVAGIAAGPAAVAAGRPGRPSLLPREAPCFTGRDDCARLLTASLAAGDGQLTIVTGPLGAGKTALAVHAAHQLADSFPGGRFFARLHDDDGALRPPREVIAQLMRAAVATARPPQDWSAQDWRAWLAEHKALVVLDDARREGEVRPFLPEAGDSAIVVTSRSRLPGLDAARVAVPPLAVAEAVALLGRVAGAPRVAAGRRAAEAIVARAGLTPLAVRLAGERLAVLRHLTLAEYATRLAAVPSLLAELSRGDGDVRQRLARAVDDLPDAARRALLRLGRLPEPVFTLDEAAAVLGTDEETARLDLEALLDASMIAVPDVETLAHAVLYEVPALVHAYARDALDGDESLAAREWTMVALNHG
jgi:DNA-binding SARP family transcriptional activator